MQTPTVTTPVKQLPPNFVKRVDSEQAIMPITFKDSLSSRLKDNVKIIDMINNSRFQRSKQRRKERYFKQNDDVHHSEEKSKKNLLDEIINKLDSALKESRTSLQLSRRCHSESKDMEERIKAFENILQEVKQNNIDNQQKLSQIKVHTEADIHPPASTYYKKAERKLLTYQGLRYNRRPNQMSTKVNYETKGHYVYPKYLKPQFSRPRAYVCIQPGCRGRCRCTQN